MYLKKKKLGLLIYFDSSIYFILIYLYKLYDFNFWFHNISINFHNFNFINM